MSKDQRALIIEHLRAAGVDGMDEDVLAIDLGIIDPERDGLTTLLRDMRTECVVEGVGECWIRLSLPEWARLLANEAGLGGSLQERFLDLLTGCDRRRSGPGAP